MKFTSSLIFLSIVVMAIVSCDSKGGYQVVDQQMVFHNPPFKSCHASTIEEIAPGHFMIAAFGGSMEGAKDVAIWVTEKSKNDRRWSVPRNVADGKEGDSLKYSTYNPVLFKAKNEKLFLFYKKGLSPSTWWGMFKTSMDNGASWSKPQKLPKGILGPIKNKPIQLPNGDILSPSSREDYITPENWPWKVQIERSEDNGRTWEKIAVDPDSGFNAIQPSILVHPDGRLQILCRTRDSEVLVQAFSDDNGDTWGKLTKTNIDNPNSGTDAVTLDNGSFALVYNPAKWKGEGLGGRSKLNLAISEDGEHWEDVLILENEEEGEFSYPAIIQGSDGKIHITYTHNRGNIKYVIVNID